MSDRRPLAALIVSLLLAAGCAQEGKLIDVPLPVKAVAYDGLFTTVANSNRPPGYAPFDTIQTVRYKILVHGENACERKRVLLELSREGLNGTIYVIKAVARYNADDACVNEGNTPGDTTMTLTFTNIVNLNTGTVPVRIRGSNGPDIIATIDSTIHSPVAQTMQFNIKVEDKTSAAAVAGATVQLDSLSTTGGAVGPITSGTTNAAGTVTFNVASTVPRGVNAFAYQVTVTNGDETVVLPVRDAPARGQSIEKITVRI